MGSKSLVVSNFLSFPAPGSEFCGDSRNAGVYRAYYPHVLSGEPPCGIFTRSVSCVGVICDLLERVYRIYESGAAAEPACAALNSAQLSFFSGIAGRDVFAAFAAVFLSFFDCSASKLSDLFSALST